MGWQALVVSQIIAGNNILNSLGSFTYSGTPGVNNLIFSDTPTSTTVDNFGNKVIPGTAASYGSGLATVLGTGFIQFYTGSLAAGWTAKGTITGDVSGDIVILAASGHAVLTNNNTLDDGSGNMAVTGLTVNGSSNTGSGNNGGVTSGPSGTVTSFPAAGPNHTHAETHQHPL